MDNIQLQEIIKRFVKPTVQLVRQELYRRYLNHDVTGLCDEAVILFTDYITYRDAPTNVDIPTFKVHTIHGELAHTSDIESKEWFNEHTWCKMVFTDDTTIYVDPTSGQFKPLFDDIPDWYVSDVKPKWYLPDEDNPVWTSKFTWILDHIRIYSDGPIGLGTWYHYIFKGKLSDRKYHKRIKQQNKTEG